MSKKRRPKPINYGLRRTLRLGAREEAAVAAMRSALAENRGVALDDVDYSEAVRLLLVENHAAAMELAGRPDSWPASTTLELPAALWDQLTECRNRLAHSQGSLYTILRKLNFDQTVDRDEVRAAFNAVQSSKDAVARMETRLLAFLSDMEAGADAKADEKAA